MYEEAELHLPESQIAPIGKRFLAFVLDSLLLGSAGFTLSLFLDDQFARMGVWARLIGFVVATGYYGAACSRYFGGKTVGKLITGIRVLGVEGSLLSVSRSFSRAAILLPPFFLNGAALGPWLTSPLLQSLLSVVVLGGSVSIVYLFVFNRPTHQSLHDLAVGSVVVRGTAPFDSALSSPPKSRHLAVVAVLAAVSAGLPWVFSATVDTAALNSMLLLADSVVSESDARATNVRSTLGGGGGAQTSLQLEIQVPSLNADLDTMGNRVVAAVLAAFPEAESRDVITVAFTYGYDLGIWSRQRTEFQSYTPADWRERIQGMQ